MADRLQEIKRNRNPSEPLLRGDADWLIDEIEGLRAELVAVRAALAELRTATTTLCNATEMYPIDWLRISRAREACCASVSPGTGGDSE